MRFAVVDTETTGGRPSENRLTEIGVILIDDGQVVGEFQSLVNPEQPIPPFVQNLTGITNQMVQSAPLFSEIAQEVFNQLQGRIFVAHNVAFDYGFIRAELAKAGFTFAPPRLCTVQVSRNAFPGQGSYSLGKIAQALGLKQWDAHRALGDARASAELLTLAVEKVGLEKVMQLAKGYVMPQAMPEGWTLARLNTVPNRAGVLRVFGKAGKLLWVGNATVLRDKVTELLKASGRKGPWAKIRTQMVDMDWTVCNSVRLARVIAVQEALQNKPPLNRPVRIPPLPAVAVKDQHIIESDLGNKESSVLFIRNGVLKGYAQFDADDFIDPRELEAGMERLDRVQNLISLLY